MRIAQALLYVSKQANSAPRTMIIVCSRQRRLRNVSSTQQAVESSEIESSHTTNTGLARSHASAE